MPETIKYSHIIEAVYGNLWAILPEKYAEIVAFLSVKAHGGDIDAETLAAFRAEAGNRPKQQKAGRIATLPLYGTISRRAGLLSEASGGTSVEGFTRDFRMLLNDPDIDAIVLDVDSPGGSVSGIEELAAEIYSARGRKPVTAVANTLMASAAYWLGSAASELVVSPSAVVGSIGVISGHEDQSGMMEKLGVKVSLVSAGKYKAENNPFEPMTDEGRAEIQKRVDETYAKFTRAVAKGRGVAVDTVRNGFGEGRVVGAQEAVSLGMADRIATLDEVVASMPVRGTVDAGQTAMMYAFTDQGYTVATANGTTAVNWSVPLTFENQSEAALSAAQRFQLRVEDLSALRAQRNQSPLAQVNVPRIQEHRDAYMALVASYDALLLACATADPERRSLLRQSQARLHDLNLWLAEVG